MNHSNLKRAGEADAPMSNSLVEMIGLGAFLAGQAPWAMMQAGFAAMERSAAANEQEQPIDSRIDDLFDNVPV